MDAESRAERCQEKLLQGHAIERLRSELRTEQAVLLQEEQAGVRVEGLHVSFDGTNLGFHHVMRFSTNGAASFHFMYFLAWQKGRPLPTERPLNTSWARYTLKILQWFTRGRRRKEGETSSAPK